MYEWLRDYHKLQEDIDYLMFNLERTQWELRRWTGGDLMDVRLNEKSKGAKVEEEIEQIKKDIYAKKQQQQKLVKLVETFRGLDTKILKMKYVDGMTLKEIAEELKYSESHIEKRHAELIRTIKFVGEYEKTFVES